MKIGQLRPSKYGKFLAEWVKLTISLLPSYERSLYRSRFIDELNKYSFQTRKKGEPRNPGCVNELEGISHFELAENPEQLAKGVKETMHLMYNKGRAKLIRDSLLENL